MKLYIIDIQKHMKHLRKILFSGFEDFRFTFVII